jgi:UPF0716 protein FxsA
LPIILLAALILVPLLEIALFIDVGEAIGLWPTLGLVVATAVLGTWQLRQQGLATLGRARAQMDRGRLPTRELFDGFCLVIAGALLLTPGFMTDSLGFALFIPPVRDAIRRALARRFEVSGQAGVGPSGDGRPQPPGPGGVIEGEYRDVSDDPADDGGGRPRS